MTLAKGLSHSVVFGICTGSLLASCTILWLHIAPTLQLPLIVTTWWLVIFGCNLLLAYRLTRIKSSPLKNLGFQFTHAAVAALIYFGLNFGADFGPAIEVASVNPEILSASVASSAKQYLMQQNIMVPTVFVLSILSSGLLYAILSKPSAR